VNEAWFEGAALALVVVGLAALWWSARSARERPRK
jgi:nitrogen fixation-related uncharacterized protein